MRHCPTCGAELAARPPVTCAACGTRHWRNAKPCAGALVVRDGAVLLVLRNHEPWLDHWDIPGGFCELHEHPASTAVREVREETGLDVAVVGLLGIWLDEYPDPATPPEDAAVTLNVYFHAEVIGGVPSPDPAEVAELGWFGPDELPSRLAFPDHASRVLAAWRRAMDEGGTRTPLYDLTT